MDRDSRVALLVLAETVLLGFGWNASQRGDSALPWYIGALVLVPYLWEAARGRLGPVEGVARGWHRWRLRRHRLPGWRAAVVRDIHGSLLALSGDHDVRFLHAEVHGPRGTYVSATEIDGPTRVGKFVFPTDFVDATGSPPPRFDHLATGRYHALWLAWHDGDRRCLAVAYFRIYPLGSRFWPWWEGVKLRVRDHLTGRGRYAVR